MNTLIWINTFVNILIIGYVAYKENRIYISVNKTYWSNKTYSISVMWNSYPVRKGIAATGLFEIPIRNYYKMELDHDIHRMINGSEQNKIQTLNAKFSWLNTTEEVEQFKKNYEVVDRRLVHDLVSKFILNVTNKVASNPDHTITHPL